MIKRILVALDPDSDTPIATRYGIELAKKFGASLSGLAVIDTKHIATESGGGGIGTIYFSEMLERHLSSKAIETARRLTDIFEQAVEEAHVEHANWVESGVPFERIIEDMKYHDLLIIGRKPHFFYNKPEKKTKTLAQVVKRGVIPVLVAGEEYVDIKKVLIAHDRSDASASTMQRFAQLNPFGTDVEIDVVNVRRSESEHDRSESELRIHLAGTYLRSHGFSQVREISLEEGPPDGRLLKHVSQNDIDLVVAGAHSISAIRRIAFGSTTSALLEDSPVPLFLYH
ncbi:MAG TPA: universal stress protein [Balneolales bacterium]|nr:universal stress protein [Balneolales bacterium]